MNDVQLTFRMFCCHTAASWKAMFEFPSPTNNFYHGNLSSDHFCAKRDHFNRIGMLSFVDK